MRGTHLDTKHTHRDRLDTRGTHKKWAGSNLARTEPHMELVVRVL